MHYCGGNEQAYTDDESIDVWVNHGRQSKVACVDVEVIPSQSTSPKWIIKHPLVEKTLTYHICSTQ